MKFQPKSKEEFDAERLLAKGAYDGLIIKAEEQTSKKGNPMIALTIQVYHGALSVLVNDWLLAGSQKLLDFCETTGLADAYMRGEVDAEMVNGRNVSVKLGIEEAKGEYQAKNKVVAYILAKPPNPPVKPSPKTESAKGMGVSETQRRNAVANAKVDDDVPF